MSFTLNKFNRLALLVLLVALVAGLGASWLWSGRVRGAQQQERRDLNLFLDASSAGWAEVTDQFFKVPESAAQSVGALVGHMESDDERIILLSETIRTSSALDAAFIGYPNGEFLFVGRSDEVAPGGFRTRRVSLDEGAREVVVTWTDSARTELRREFDPADTYDPRERPWYLTSASGQQNRWTDPYVFSSSQQPGITYSSQVFDDQGDHVAVVGIDIRLSELGGFLDQLAPGPNGEAMVLDVDGNVIAASTMDASLSFSEVENALSEDKMNRLAASIERVRSGETSLVRTHSPSGLSTTVTRAVRGEDDWYLTVQATDSDFLGDFSNGSFKNVAGIILIGLAAAIIAGTLGYQLVRYRDTLKTEAERDELTGLLSRRAIRRALDARLRGGHETVAVAIVDLDGFKSVNDRHGHLMGDTVLAAMATRIDGFASAENAIAGRLGGDEFAVIGLATTNWPELTAQLAEPLIVETLNFELGASIGVANADPQDLRTAEDILRAADRALFSVKRSGGGRVAFAGAYSHDQSSASST